MRARNLKPSFFKNEDLAKCLFEARILFQGLWCMADRDGKLEDRPLRIKAEVFPFDSVDTAKLLAELEAASGEDPLIIRYTVAGKAYIKIPNFRKHANPHYSEKSSNIPEPQPFECNTGDLTNRNPLNHESCFMNHESGILNPEVRESAKPTPPRPKTPTPKQLVELWNEMADPSLPRVRLVSDNDGRLQKAKVRLNENPEKQFWVDIITRVNASPFMKGDNARGWKCDFGFIVNSATNLGKILEGKYDRKPSGVASSFARP